jgi:hypothetical protein
VTTDARSAPIADPAPTASAEAAPHLCPCTIVGHFVRLALTIALLLLLAGAVAELALRKVAGIKPVVLAAAGLSPVIPDTWTGYRLRPNVPGPPDWIVTNEFGMHATRSYALGKRRPRKLRVAVLGSSVVYGLGHHIENTIPAAAERALKRQGRPAEVMNFGTHSFNIVNVSAMTQAYVQQFEPSAIVVVIDYQVGYPIWPMVTPSIPDPTGGVRKLDWREALVKRASERSALFTVIDDPSTVRPFVLQWTRLPLEPSPHPSAAPGGGTGAGAIPAAANTAPVEQAPLPPEEIRAYEERRRRDLAAPLAAMAAFCREKKIALYFMTPYGPYFDFTDDELAHMTIHHFMIEARRVYGSERRALPREVETITDVVHQVAAAYSAHVIDMLEPSRRASMHSPPYFGNDGVHFTAEGNVAVGKLIAAQLARDFPLPAR